MNGVCIVDLAALTCFLRPSSVLGIALELAVEWLDEVDYAWTEPDGEVTLFVRQPEVDGAVGVGSGHNDWAVVDVVLPAKGWSEGIVFETSTALARARFLGPTIVGEGSMDGG